MSQTVVGAVAEATDADLLALEPRLYEVIDPDALDRLFDGKGSTGEVEFRMAGCTVSVHADGRVVVVPPERAGTTGVEHGVGD